MATSALAVDTTSDSPEVIALASRRPRLSGADKSIIGMLGFCILIGWSLELYWCVHRTELVGLASTNWIANLFRIYGEADSSYFAVVSPLSLGLETISVYITQLLNIWLIFAILKHRPYRHALQLAVASYLTYSVVFYFWSEQLNGWGHMRAVTPWLMFLYVAPNLPWLLFHAFMIGHSSSAITKRFAAA
jgi:hypothetical protein